MAVNCYVEPVYTLDADIVVITASLPKLTASLRDQGFEIEEHSYSVNAKPPGSQLRIQFSTDERYQAFLARSVQAEVLGVLAKIASVHDVVQDKLWTYGDPRRRLSKRKKDELDLIRLTEKYPESKASYPRRIERQRG